MELTEHEELVKKSIEYWKSTVTLAYIAIEKLQLNCKHKYELIRESRNNNDWDQFPSYTKIYKCIICDTLTNEYKS